MSNPRNMSAYDRARRLKRASGRTRATHGLHLQSLIEKFVQDCQGKDSAEIRRMFTWYNQRWITYAREQSRHSAFRVYPTAFESSIQNAWKEINKLKKVKDKLPFDLETAERVFRLFRPRPTLGGLVGSIVDWAKAFRAKQRTEKAKDIGPAVEQRPMSVVK